MWTSHTINALVEKARRRQEFKYGKVETDYLYNAFDQYPVREQQGLVLGTETPWLEAILLANGMVLKKKKDCIHGQQPMLSFEAGIVSSGLNIIL